MVILCAWYYHNVVKLGGGINKKKNPHSVDCSSTFYLLTMQLQIIGPTDFFPNPLKLTNITQAKRQLTLIVRDLDHSY